MLFNSFTFIFFFLPLCLILYFVFNRKGQKNWAKGILVLMSLYFYAFFNLSYLPIILISILCNYAVCKGIGHSRRHSEEKGVNDRSRWMLAAGIVFNLGVLGYFKYYDFFVSNINSALSTDFTLKHLILPLGISFYTFQEIAMLVDVYRRDVSPTPRFLDFCIYVTFFPQLIAGPIVLASETIPQFNDPRNHNPRYKNLFHGLYVFAVGLAKKVVIADTIAIFADAGFNTFFPDYTFKEAWLVSLSYTLQLYFDFSGYCDMAIGLALMFNIKLPENFNKPYLATSFRDFWHRWHITLNRFFTNYVYFPLGGSRKGELRAHGNTMLVFTLSGLWHGANWTFVIWGILHGSVVCVNRLWKRCKCRIPAVFSIIITFFLINVFWVIFRADNLDKVKVLYKGMFANTDFYFRDDFMRAVEGTPLPLKVNFGILLAAAVLAFFAPTAVSMARYKRKAVLAVAAFVILVVCMFFINRESPFLYFNF